MTGATPAGNDLTDPEGFAHWVTHELRFSDLDTLGHVNHLAFGALMESGRIAFFRGLGIRPGESRRGFILVRLAIDYRAEMTFPGGVRVGTRALRLGRSSFTVGQGLFQGDHCTATGETVLAYTDRDAGRSMPVPDEIRALIPLP